jgi:rod shape-determining protein MreD
MAFLKGAGGLLFAWLSLYFQGAILPESIPHPDGFLILVVYYAVSRPQIPAMLIGTVAGLTEDSLSALLGVHAFTKTTIGYVVAGLGSRFMLNQPLPQFLILVAGTPCEVLLQRVLMATVGQGFVWPDPLTLILQSLVNGIVGVVVIRLVKRFM